MTPRELFEAIGLVDDSLVLEADAPAVSAARPWLAVARRWVPLAACLCLVAGGAALALRGGVLGGKASGSVMMSGATADAAAPRSGEAAAPAPAAEPDGNGAAAGGAEPGAAAPEEAPNALESTEGATEGLDRTADGAYAGKAVCGIMPERADGTGNVMYWGSQLEPALQEALWGDGEAEPWQDVLAALLAEVQPGAEPATLPVLCDGKSIGQYALCSQADAQALLFDGAFLSAEGVPRGGTNPANALDAELVYNPAGAALRVPMWAFTVPTDMDYGDVVCYVPAVDLEALRQLVLDRYGG